MSFPREQILFPQEWNKRFRIHSRMNERYFDFIPAGINRFTDFIPGGMNSITILFTREQILFSQEWMMFQFHYRGNEQCYDFIPVRTFFIPAGMNSITISFPRYDI